MTAPAILQLEHAVWTPGAEWRAALEHLASRFARVRPLDLDALEAAGPLAAQLELLDAWAATSSADVDRELGRFLDEHLALHVRPEPSVTRAVRALASERAVVLASALPPRPAEAIARHCGIWRSVAQLAASVRTAGALRELAEDRGAILVIDARTSLLAPAG